MYDESPFAWEEMQDPEPDWAGTFTVRVPLHEYPEEDWAQAFVELANRREVRGGRWGSISIYGRHVEVDGVGRGSEDALRSFLGEAAQRADSLAEQESGFASEMGDRFRGAA